MMIRDPRRGRFVISIEMIDREPELVREMMKGLIILHTDHGDYMSGIRYSAIGNVFEPVKPGELIPMYAAEMSCDSKGNRKFLRWRKVQ